ncbi:MAG: cytochrome c oxidase subunit II [Cytophagaceae bacterium]
MTGLYIGISIVLILAILFLIFRISTFINVMKGGYTRRVGYSNRVNAFLLLAFWIIALIGFFWFSNYSQQFYLPQSVSEHGLVTDKMFWVTMAILVAAFIVTNMFLFYFVFKYQYREGKKAYFYPENHKLEFVWTVIPAIVMAILVYFGWRTWSDITRPAPEDSEVVEIMGKQFAWQVRYPGQDKEFGRYNFRLIDPTNEMGLDIKDPKTKDDFIPSEIHIPKGRNVLFRIRARDVIHSVFAPHFRLKMDAVPGMPTKFWFKPLKTTAEMREQLGNPKFNYELACTEICGRGHFAMRFVIVVDEPEDYAKWYASQKAWTDMNMEYVTPRVPEELKSLYNIPAATGVIQSADTTAVTISLNN